MVEIGLSSVDERRSAEEPSCGVEFRSPARWWKGGVFATGGFHSWMYVVAVPLCAEQEAALAHGVAAAVFSRG